MKGKGDTTSRLTGGGGGDAGVTSGGYRGRRGLDPQIVERIRHQFGFDKPPLTRFWNMLVSYLSFDFGSSLFQGGTVLVADREQDAGQPVDRAVVDAVDLLRLDPARHRQSGAARQPVRRGDVGRRAGRLRDPRHPVRDSCWSCCSPEEVSSVGFRCAA